MPDGSIQRASVADIVIIGTEGEVLDYCTVCPMCAALAMRVNAKGDKFVCLSCTAFFGIN